MKTFREYINLIENAQTPVEEGWKSLAGAAALTGALIWGANQFPDLEVNGQRYQMTSQHALADAPTNAKTVEVDGKTYKIWTIRTTKGSTEGVYAQVKSVKEQGVAEGSDDKPVEAHGVYGMKFKPWRQTFKNQAAFKAWLARNKGHVEVRGTRTLDEQGVAEDQATAKMGLMSAMGSNDNNPAEQRRSMAQQAVEQLASKK